MDSTHQKVRFSAQKKVFLAQKSQSGNIARFWEVAGNKSWWWRWLWWQVLCKISQPLWKGERREDRRRGVTLATLEYLAFAFKFVHPFPYVLYDFISSWYTVWTSELDAHLISFVVNYRTYWKWFLFTALVEMVNANVH